MEPDTPVLRRLRDRLLAAHDAARAPAGDDGSAALDPEQRAAAARVGPLAEILFLMMVSDADIAARERDAIAGAVHVLTDGVLPRGEADRMLAGFERALAEQGRDARLHQLGAQLALDRAEAEAAFTVAAAVALADDRVAHEERELLQTLREWLGISKQRAAALLA